MKKKSAAFLCLAAAAALTFAGCDSGSSGTQTQQTQETEMTAQSLAAEIADHCADAGSASLTQKLSMDVNIAYGGTDYPISMSYDFSGETTNDPLALHMTGKVSTTTAGETTDMDNEVYNLVDGNTETIYSNQNGAWYKTAVDISDQNITDFLNTRLYRSIADGEVDADLTDETEQVNDQDCYVITSDLTGDVLQDILADVMSENSMDTSSIDWAHIKAPIRILVYKDSLLPANFTLDARELGTAVFACLFDQVFGSGNYETTVNSFTVEYGFSDFGNVDPISVPDDVIEGAVDLDSTEETQMQ